MKQRGVGLAFVAATLALAGCGSEVTALGSTAPATGGGGGTGGGGEAGTGGDATGTGGQGGTSQGGGGGIPTPSCLESLAPECEKYANAYCNQLFGCASFFGRIAYGDSASCKADIAAACQTLADAPDSAAEPSYVAGCAKALATSTCGNLLAGNLGEACAPPAGPRSDGSSCLTDSQCQSTFCGHTNPGNGCGTCMAPPQEGDPCVGRQCGYGLDCMGTGQPGGGVCSRPRLKGETCTTAMLPPNCGAAFYCRDGVCQDRLGPGEQCQAGMMSQPCDIANGYACVPPQNGTCTELTLAQPGQACNPNVGLYCQGGTCQNGKCVATIDICEEGCSQQATCRFGVCDAGTCEVPDTSFCK